MSIILLRKRFRVSGTAHDLRYSGRNHFQIQKPVLLLRKPVLLAQLKVLIKLEQSLLPVHHPHMALPLGELLPQLQDVV